MADQADIPEEIKDYYHTEKRERTGIAWLLAFGTLIVTVMLGAGIFFAGRWAYREIVGTDESTSVPTEVAQNQEEDQPASSNTQDQNDQSDEQDNQGGQGSGEVQGNEDEDGSEEPQEVSGATDDSREDEPETAPVTGSSSDNLPGTGPSGTLVVFIIVSSIGYFVHRFKLWRILSV